MQVTKFPSVQTYKLLLYQRPLHPELFAIQDRRTLAHGGYELESWVIPGGHVLRFQGGGQCLSEAVTDEDQHLPQRGLLHAVPCLGEKDFEDRVESAVQYFTSVQTETLSENLYQATLAEMLAFADEAGAMIVRWTDSQDSDNLSVLDLQTYRKEVHAQSYHLIGSAGFVLRTQTIFEVL
jgi:hypothetical protein